MFATRWKGGRGWSRPQAGPRFAEGEERSVPTCLCWTQTAIESLRGQALIYGEGTGELARSPVSTRGAVAPDPRRRRGDAGLEEGLPPGTQPLTHRTDPKGTLGRKRKTIGGAGGLSSL